MSYSQPTRARALEAGLWIRSDGEVVRLRHMNDHHLINALLKALQECEGPSVTGPLTAEVVRRNLHEAAMAVAEERSKR